MTYGHVSIVLRYFLDLHSVINTTDIYNKTIYSIYLCLYNEFKKEWWYIPLSCSTLLSYLLLRARVAQWGRSLDLTAHTSVSAIRRGFAPSFVNCKKGPLDSQPHVKKFTSCLPRVGGSLQVLRLPPPLKLVAMI